MTKGKRSYVQTARQEKMEQTRIRIVDAIMALHEEVGPSNTTVAAVADRAGVQRLTVYRHFPDESAMLEACSSRFVELNPPPDPSLWDSGLPPLDFAQAALSDYYAHYGRTQAMLAKVYRDAPTSETLAAIMAQFDAFLRQIADMIADHFALEPEPAGLRPTLRHLVRFGTWQELETQGISNPEKVALALGWIRGCLA